MTCYLFCTFKNAANLRVQNLELLLTSLQNRFLNSDFSRHEACWFGILSQFGITKLISEKWCIHVLVDMLLQATYASMGSDIECRTICRRNRKITQLRRRTKGKMQIYSGKDLARDRNQTAYKLSVVEVLWLTYQRRSKCCHHLGVMS